MIKLSDTGYVHTTIKEPGQLLGLVTAKCVPTGKTRTAGDGDIEAEFFLISTNHPARLLWLRREEIW